MIRNSDPLRYVATWKSDCVDFGGRCSLMRRLDGSVGALAREGETLGEFLSRPENAGGVWLFDTQGGGPPPPLALAWSESLQAWRFFGFCDAAARPEVERWQRTC